MPRYLRFSVFVALTFCVAALGTMRDARSGDLLQNDRRYPNIVRPERVIGAHGVGAGHMINPRGVAYGPRGTSFVAECGNDRVEEFSPSGAVLRAWGTYGKAPGQFICPAGIAVASDGTVFVADSGNDRIEAFRSDGTFRYAFGRFGHAPGDLSLPRGIALANDRVYVANAGADRIDVYTRGGRFLFAFGGSGTGPGMFAKPAGVAVNDRGDVFVADMYNNRIQKFDKNGRYVKSWGQLGSYNGFFGAPADVAVDPHGRLFVADSVNHRVQVFDAEGTYLYQFGRHPVTPHAGDGRLHYPLALAASPGGMVTVCEKFEDRCQTFDTAKAARSYVVVNDNAWWRKYPYFHYRTHCAIKASPNQYLLMTEEELHRVEVAEIVMNGAATTLKTLRFIGTYGVRPGQFKQPLGIAMDNNHNIWVSDTLNHRIQVFNVNGRLLRIIGGGRGTGPGQFDEPGSMAFDSKGFVYVVDAGNNRIQVLNSQGAFVRMLAIPATPDAQMFHPINVALDPTETRLYVNDLTAYIKVYGTQGNFLFKFGGYGLEPGQFRSPLRLTVARDGMVYVSDEALNHVTKFTPDGKVLLRWGKHGDGPGEFYMPLGVCADSQNRLWVIDYGNHRGQTFTPDGKFLFFFGENFIGRERPSGSAFKE